MQIQIYATANAYAFQRAHARVEASGIARHHAKIARAIRRAIKIAHPRRPRALGASVQTHTVDGRGDQIHDTALRTPAGRHADPDGRS
jgi:hypothetical protein